ncbi:uncharacterized protein LOC117641128 isoform X2 [Thrips palmi]|uniref:Uncharacterized protein LOC117641128 isoform X2 n=1 Tax=Thrips palmi TaxID=161013 RepID=A0A6P8YBI3_THRPL|nr:uncharacterized protein LOC117641128 isoform X2 [Thrips palmi]
MSHGRGTAVNLTGYLGDLWSIFEKTLNFRSVYMRASGNTARFMLHSEVADVYLSATVVTTEEDDQFYHTQPVVTHWYHLFVRKGAPQVSADSYIRALSPSMWAMTLAAVLLLCVVLRAMVWLRTAVGMGSGMEPANTSLGHCFLAVLGCICTQGWQESPSCLSIRLIVVTTLLFGYLLCNSYSAVLISYLASGHSTAPFSGLDDVAKKGTHVLCVRNESYAYLTLKRSGKWASVLNKGVCRDASQSERVADALCDTPAVALEIPSVMAASLEARPDCRGRVQRVRERMQRGTASVLLRPGFPYTRALDYMITRCRATGVLDRLEKTYLDGLTIRSSSGQDFDDTSVTAIVQVSKMGISSKEFEH